MAVGVRFASHGYITALCTVFTCVLTLLWSASVRVPGGHEPRFVGAGSDEFRRVLNAAVSLLAGIAIVSYAAKLSPFREYVMLALPSANQMADGGQSVMMTRRAWSLGSDPAAIGTGVITIRALPAPTTHHWHFTQHPVAYQRL